MTRAHDLQPVRRSSWAEREPCPWADVGDVPFLFRNHAVGGLLREVLGTWTTTGTHHQVWRQRALGSPRCYRPLSWYVRPLQTRTAGLRARQRYSDEPVVPCSGLLRQQGVLCLLL